MKRIVFALTLVAHMFDHAHAHSHHADDRIDILLRDINSRRAIVR